MSWFVLISGFSRIHHDFFPDPFVGKKRNHLKKTKCFSKPLSMTRAFSHKALCLVTVKRSVLWLGCFGVQMMYGQWEGQELHFKVLLN